MADADDALLKRLQALRSADAPVATDGEMLAKSRQLRGMPAPLATPPAGWLPPSQPPSVPTASLSSEDARLGKLVDAFAGSGSCGGDATEMLMQQAADMVRLEGGHGGGMSGTSRPEDLSRAELAALADPLSDASLVAPGRAELSRLGAEASAMLGEIASGGGGCSRAGVSGSTLVSTAACALDTAETLALDDDDDDDDDDDGDGEAAEAELLLAAMQEELELEARYGGSMSGATAPELLPASAVPVAVPVAPHTPSNREASLFPSAPTHHVVVGVPVAPAAATRVVDETERWCSICNEDAAVWCAGCDGDPYCKRCWREGHTGADATFTRHRTVPISQPRPVGDDD
mmetsp:Transcript_42397/g.111621  ORF Transcript_42397/g.111621 Transcript_42397/m.111621 type:complete len:347 (+) Transcript_42397:418-1458(+)